jgi:RHS repeat-associated protein
MKKFITIIIAILMMGLLTATTQAATQAVTVTQVLGSSNTSVTAPVQYLTDGNPGSAWISEQTTPGPAWAVLQLANSVLINGLQLYGPWTGELTVQYWQNGSWHSFLAASHLKAETFTQGWNLLDLSYDRIVTNQIRIWIDNPEKLSQISGIGEVMVLGHTSQDVLERLDPVSVTSNRNSDNNHPLSYLFDHNTYSSWWLKAGNPTNGEALADLGQVCTIQRIKIFSDSNVSDQFKLQYLSGSNWLDIPGLSNLNIQQIGAAWQSFNLPDGISTNQIKVVFNNHQKVGGIREIEIWGHKASPTGSSYLDSNQAPIVLSNITSANYAFNITTTVSDPVIMHVVTAGNPTTPLTWELNGQAMGNLNPAGTIRGLTVYQQAIPANLFWSGANFIRIDGAGAIVSDCKLEISYAATLNFSGALSDRWLLTSVASGAVGSEQIIELGGTYHIDDLVLSYLGNQPQAQIYIDQNGGWVALSNIPTISSGIVGGELSYTGIGIVHRIKVDFDARIDEPAEITIHGSKVNDGPPQVRILSPINGALFNLSGWGQANIIGTVDNPDVIVRVNGQGMTLNGTSFNVPLPVAGNPDSDKTIQVVATDSQGRTGSDQVSILISNPPDFTVNLPDQLIYTSGAQITVSGKVVVPQSQVTINGAAVSLSNLNFSKAVTLDDGLNLINIKVVYPGNPRWAVIQRRVVKTASPPCLNVLTPVDGQVVKGSQIVVSGQVSSLTPVTVTVNGKAATVNSGYFYSDSLTLVEKTNKITVIATDQNGLTSQVVLTVTKDSTPPSLTEVTPADGTWLNTLNVSISGTVTDASPVAVLVNGQAATITGNQFTASVMMQEGANTLNIQATDSAGNTASVTRSVLIDTVAPAEFTPTVNISGWSNNNKPIVTFSTKDTESGIDHYEISVDSSVTVKPITSPYAFVTVISDGEHTIKVWAYDKAGNVREGDVKVDIDTTPPDEPQDFRVVPGNGLMVIRWTSSLANDVIEYHIERDPAGNPSPYIATTNQYTDTGLVNGVSYKYRIYAVDHAGNQSQFSDWKTGMVGLAVVSYIPDKGSVVEYHNVTLFVNPQSLPTQIQNIKITEVTSDAMQKQAAFPIVSPIYQFSATYNDGKIEADLDHIPFQKNFIGTISYDPAKLDTGFPEQNLGVYYYDPMWNRWFKVPNSAVDVTNHVIYFSTNHFTCFVTQETLVQDLTPQELKDVGYSPFKTNSTHGGVTISPQGGSSMINVTELALPGRNGFDFVLKRTYDSATARGDCQSLVLNAALGLSFFNSQYNEKQLENFGKQLLQSAKVQVADQIQAKLKSYFQNNGDYSYSMGVGWRLNLPYIRGSNGGVVVRLPDGSFFTMNSLNLKKVGDDNGFKRSLIFENHEGEDFTLYVTQERLDVDYVSLVQNGTFLIPGWQLLSAKLVLKDGTTYEMDSFGRTSRITDPSGLNTIVPHYSNLLLDYITDSMGRKINFYHNDEPIVPRINKIVVENDNREIDYKIGSQIGTGGLTCPLLKQATDVGGRVWKYDYGQNLLIAGGAGVKINILYTIIDYIYHIGLDDITISGNIQSQWVFPLTEVEGPGIGYTKINYDQKVLTYDVLQATDYFLGLFPVSIEYKFQMLQQLYANRLDIYMYHGDRSPVKTVNYNYDVDYRDNEQFIVAKTTENDGRKRTVYYYDSITKSYIRFIDFSDYAAEVINGLKSNGLNGLFMENPYAYNVVPYNTGEEIYDAKTGALLEKTSVTNDLDLLRPTQQITYRGSYYQRLIYTYDNWGNVTSVNDFSYSGDNHVTETKTWMYYLGTSSSPSKDVTWLGLPFNQVSLTNARNDLMVGKVVANYIPSISGKQTINYLDTYNQYNKLGQLTGSAQWSGTEWLITQYEYHPTFGSLTKKTNPEGHVTVYDYDTKGLPSAVTEQSVVDAADVSTDIVTKTGYDYTTGWKLWQQDPRGYVTEYQYDALGRTTQITAPDDDDQIGWIPNGTVAAFRSNNPVTNIVYDDQQLTSLVTDPLGNQTKYCFDNLGRLSQLIKYHQENGSAKNVITTVAYNGWGDITAITDPNNNITGYKYDAMGRNIEIDYPAYQGTSPVKYMDYNYNYNLLTVTDENNKTSYEYQDMQGRTYKKIQVDVYVPIVTEHYFDGLGNEVITVDPKGSVTTKTYNLLNELSRVDLPTENFWEKGVQSPITPYQIFNYNKAGFKIAEIHSLAGSSKEITNKFDVDALGRTIRTRTPYSDAGVSKVAVTETYYDANSNKSKVIDVNNTLLPREEQKAYHYEYTATNLLKSETDPAGNKTTYTYDLVGNRVSVTDPRGNSGKYSGDFTIVYHYNDLNRLDIGYMPASNGQSVKPEVNLKYDARGNLIERVEPDGGKTTYTYTPRNKVETVTVSGDGVSYTTVHHYDPANNETEVIDAHGYKTSKTYDDLNRLVGVTYPEPNGQVTESYSYDENGNKIEYINGRMMPTYYNYDRYNHLIEVTDINSGTTSYGYDRWGNQTRMVNALGHTANYDYDELNRLIKETDPQGYVKQYNYDAAGNRVGSLDPNGTAGTYEYTPNNLVKKITLQNGSSTQRIQYSYDEAGYKEWANNGNVTTLYNNSSGVYVPDPFGRIYSETKNYDGKSFTTAYDYDVMGRLTQITYPTGQTVNYNYNKLGQLQKVPGFVDDTPVYDNGGWLKSLKAVNGVTTAYNYDENGRLTNLSYSNQTDILKSYALKYDGANNIVQKNDDRFIYDALNQLSYADLHGNFEIDPDEENQKFGHAQDDFKGQQSFNFETELNQMDIFELDYAAGSIGVDLLAPVKITRLEIKPNSPINRVTKASSIRLYYSIDNNTYTRIKDWQLTITDKGVLEIVLNAPIKARYFKVKSMFDERDYDNFSAIDQAQFKNTAEDLIHVYYLMDTRSEDYVYDAIGNRIHETITQRYPIVRDYSYYPNSSRLKSNEKYDFEYDPNGNLVKKTKLIKDKAIWNYDYDLLNRLIKVTKNDQTVAEYMYDDSGLRLKKQGPKNTTYYTFDTGGNVLYEQENKGYMEYVYVLGKHFARVNGRFDNSITKKYFYQTDNLGSTVLVTDETGKQVYSSEYTPFGKKSSVDGELDHVTQFTGKDLDEDIGLYYFNARWYDQEVGRFISEDEGEDPNNLNLYEYCRNNPLTITDPTGLISQEDAMKLNELFTTTSEHQAPPKYVQKIINDNVEAHGFENVTKYGLGLLKIQAENSNQFYQNGKKVPELVQLEKATGMKFDNMFLSYFQLEYKHWNMGSNVAAENFRQNSERVNQALEVLGFAYSMGLISSQGAMPNNPEGEFKPFNLSKVDASQLNSKPLYRVMSESELNAVKETSYLRGGKEGTTYFTDSYYKNASNAQNRLSLPNEPQYVVEFKIVNNPSVRGGNTVKPAYGGTGGGREYFTNDPVKVDIINYQKLK